MANRPFRYERPRPGAHCRGAVPLARGSGRVAVGAFGHRRV